MVEHEDTAARLDAWLSTLETRHLSELTFQEVSRSLRALSSAYVERRATLSKGGALSGAGKRAAFALYYGPLHFLLLDHIVRALGAPFTGIDTLLDLGCGTGAAGAGWALACRQPPRVLGIDRHPWAIDEVRRTLSELGVPGSGRIDDLTRVPMAGVQRTERVSGTAQASHRGRGVLLAFAVNEIDSAQQRDALRDRLLAQAAGGGQVLVVEPLAGFVAPWWSAWQRAFEAQGGRADEWRFEASLPPLVDKLARAAGLRPRELKARTLSS